jgi:hypothetical protein
MVRYALSLVFIPYSLFVPRAREKIYHTSQTVLLESHLNSIIYYVDER